MNRLLSSILALDLDDNLILFYLILELRDESGTDLLKANVFGILPKASPTNVQSILSDKAMVVEANTAVEKEKTCSCYFVGWHICKSHQNQYK